MSYIYISLYSGVEVKHNYQISLDFITSLNSRHPTIKFDFKYLKSSIKILDSKIYKNKEENNLLTIYRKPTDRTNFLDPTPAHPKSLINGIPFNKALRLKKICSETSELNKNLNELRESFINCGYKEHFLTDQFNRISEVTREVLLISK